MKKRIAIVVPEYRTEAAPGGGVSTVADFVYDAFLAEPDWDVEIVSPRMWSRAQESQRIRAPKSWLPGPQLSIGQVRDVAVSYVGSHFSEIEALRYLPRRKLREKLSSFDVVVVVCGTPAIINAVRGFNKPILAQVATTVFVERARLVTKGSLLRRIYAQVSRAITYRLDRSGIRVADVVLVENSWMGDWCRKQGARRVELEIPGIDTSFFSPSGSKEASGVGDGYIVSVGRLNDARKDFGLLVRAYSEAVLNHKVSQKLVIAGREDLPAEVYEDIDRLGLRSKIQIRRDLSPEELRDLYRGADLFAMSSSEEGLGLVLLEAMACGTPIVTTATEGAKSVVSAAGTGKLVDFGEGIEPRLAMAIAELANDEIARTEQSVLARAAAVDRFSMHNAGTRFRHAVAMILPS